MLKNLFAILLALLILPAHAELVIDDFETGPFSLTLNTGTWVGSQVGTMLGGERDVSTVFTSNPQNRAVQISIAGGSLTANGEDSVSYNLFLDYDGVGDEIDAEYPPERGPGLGNIDLTGYGDRFQFSVLSTNQTQLWGSLYVIDAANNSLYYPFIFEPWEPHEINFSQLSGDHSILTRADRIALGIFMGDSGDITMGGFAVVPEPASLIALSLAFSMLWKRAKRANL